MPRDLKTRTELKERIKARLLEELGNECVECGSRDDLQIDHPYGRDWKPCRTNSYNRWLRYQREHLQGLIRLLCGDCNKKIRPKKLTEHEHEPKREHHSENPF